ncbi:MAG: signal recognition particle protein [Candidatus Eremiobacteraeota bacterium]|nr:signal recognition particle protein [Candidatus Eremiobacteraeota bacterium]
MFESLQEKLGNIFKKLRSRGKLTEKDVELALREVRQALLEADVNLKVVRDFINRVKEKAVGEAVWKSLTPGQLVIKFVKDELVELMGSTSSRLDLSPDPPTIVMVVGLHGSGKTTTCGKLAGHFKEKGHHPLLVATDIYRPAAIAQLKVLGDKLEVPVYTLGEKQSPVNICKGAMKAAATSGRDIVIIDTAGRLHIDEELMKELVEVKSSISPHEILLVVDAMTGQDAVNIAESFNKALSIDGVVLTKMDGDARGGAALSVKAVTGKPIKFVGVGEKLDAIEVFHPDRMASRILGMGDVLGLIEKAEATFDVEKAEELEKKLRTQELTLGDFLVQLQQVRQMGPLDQLLDMIPGMSGMGNMKGMVVDEKQLGRIEAIIQSMTPQERNVPSILNAGRRRRIASGSGTSVADVNRLLKQYDMAKKMVKQLAGFEKTKRRPAFKLPF